MRALGQQVGIATYQPFFLLKTKQEVYSKLSLVAAVNEIKANEEKETKESRYRSCYQ